MSSNELVLWADVCVHLYYPSAKRFACVPYLALLRKWARMIACYLCSAFLSFIVLINLSYTCNPTAPWPQYGDQEQSSAEASTAEMIWQRRELRILHSLSGVYTVTKVNIEIYIYCL